MLLLLACFAPDASPVAADTPAAGALPEADAAYAGVGAWSLGGHTLTLAGTVLSADGATLLRGVYEAPVLGADTLWVPADVGVGDGAIWAVRVHDGALVAAPVVQGGRPDRLALGPDGTLAFVSGASGLASVWVLPPEGEARQLTNRGLVPTPGRAPAGFVAPPTRAAPRFHGDRLRWDTRGQAVEVPWR